jgi:hypothetical protein
MKDVAAMPPTVAQGDSMGNEARRAVRRSLLARLDAALDDSRRRTEANLLGAVDPTAASRQRAALSRRRNPLVGLLSTLVAACDVNGVAWIKQRTLAERVGRDERTVRRQLRQLEALGILEVSAVCWTREGAVAGTFGGRQGANRYQLLDVWTASPTRTTEQVADDCVATVSTSTVTPEPSVTIGGVPMVTPDTHVRGGADMATALYSQQINSKVVVAQAGAAGFQPASAGLRASSRGGHDSDLVGFPPQSFGAGTAATFSPSGRSATADRDQLRTAPAPTGMGSATADRDQLRDDLHSPLANAIRDTLVDAFPDMLDGIATELALQMQPHPDGLAKAREIVNRAQTGGKGCGYVVTAMRAEIRKPSKLVATSAPSRDAVEAEPSGLARYGEGHAGADLAAHLSAEREAAEARFMALTGMVAA